MPTILTAGYGNRGFESLICVQIDGKPKRAMVNLVVRQAVQERSAIPFDHFARSDVLLVADWNQL